MRPVNRLERVFQKTHGLLSGNVPAPDGAGYDEHDLRALREVGDYRFGDLFARAGIHMLLPAHPHTTFNEFAFLASVQQSISLSGEEKVSLLRSLPVLTQAQIEELLVIFCREFDLFSQLSPKHLPELRKREVKSLAEWREVERPFRGV